MASRGAACERGTSAPPARGASVLLARDPLRYAKHVCYQLSVRALFTLAILHDGDGSVAARGKRVLLRGSTIGRVVD